MNRYIKVATILIAAIVLAVMAAIVTRPAQEKTPLETTASEAIEVLESYKSYKLQATETKDKLAYLYEQLERLETETTDAKDKEAITMVELYIWNIKARLGFHGSVTSGAVDEAVQGIKRAISK